MCVRSGQTLLIMDFHCIQLMPMHLHVKFDDGNIIVHFIILHECYFDNWYCLLIE